MEYTEMLETLKEHEDNLPEGQTLEAIIQARETISDLYEALDGLVDHFRTNDENYWKSDLCTDAIAALAKAEGK